MSGEMSVESTGTKGYEICRTCRHAEVHPDFGNRWYVCHCDMYREDRKPVTVIDLDYCVYHEEG